MYRRKSLKHFAKHLFLVSGVYIERNKARGDVYSHLQNMRKSIIRMNLSYSDIERLKKKIDNLINLERAYAKFFKPEDNRTIELKGQINALEQELMQEKEEKESIINENNEKINRLTESLGSVKSKMRYVLIENAKRQHRLRALENKITESVDVHRYYHS